MTNRLWITAKVMVESGREWELVGVFDSRELAVAACTDWRHCIWPMNLNEASPDETIVHTEAEYPIPRTGDSA